MISAVQQLADDLRSLADEAVEAEELAEPFRAARAGPSGPGRRPGRRRGRCRGSPRRRGTSRARACPARRARCRRGRARSPTTPRTTISVRFGPEPVDERAPAEAGDDRDDRQRQQDEVRDGLGQAHRLGRHDAHDDDDRVDRVGVEEPPEQEAPSPGTSCACWIVVRSWVKRRRGVAQPSAGRVPGVGGSRTTQEDRDREQPEQRGRDEEDARRPAGRAGRSGGRRRSCRSSRSRPRSPTACRASPGSSPSGASRRSR